MGKKKLQTKYQIALDLLERHAAAVLPTDGTATCPKVKGPQIGFLTCAGCRYNKYSFLYGVLCTHPKACEVSATLLARAKAWEQEQRKPKQETLF